MDTAVEGAHFPHPTATHDTPHETSTLNGIHQLMKSTNLSFLCLLSFSVTRSEATCDMPPVTSPETSSTQTSGEG